MANTVEVMGKKFLKCQQQDCEWNIGWLEGRDWTEEPDQGIRICDLGARAMIEASAVPPNDCHQPSAVLELVRTEFEI